MLTTSSASTYALGDRQVGRLGYGSMQLAGPHVFGPPADRNAAIAVLREAVALGVTHLDTSDFYGPHITNQIIREALHPYPQELTIATKVGAKRDASGAWLPAMTPEALTQAVHDNLKHLGLDVLEVVNLRSMLDMQRPVEGSLEPQLTALAELQQRGLIRHIGLSNVTAQQVEEGRALCRIVCVQNHYNLVHRTDDALIDALAREGIAYVPFFPLGGFSPLQSAAPKAPGCRRSRRRSSSGPCTTTCATWAWTCWRSSTCASWATLYWFCTQTILAIDCASANCAGVMLLKPMWRMTP